MKYRVTRTPKRTDALFLALNWCSSDQEDIARMGEFIAMAKSDGVTYTCDDIRICAARKYIGRFRTVRLRKKYSDDLHWLRQAELMKKDKG